MQHGMLPCQVRIFGWFGTGLMLIIRSGWQGIILVRAISLLPLELLPAHWTESLAAVLVDPGEEAVHVKGVAAFADYYEGQRDPKWTVVGAQLTESAVVARKLASRTGSIKLDAADTTYFILRHIPSPSSNGMPGLDGDFHDCLTRGGR